MSLSPNPSQHKNPSYNTIDQTTTTSNPSWTQMSGGVAAMAYSAIMEVMDMLEKLQQNMHEMIYQQTQAECKSAALAAQGTIQAAKDQADMLMLQSIEAFASAGITAIGGRVSRYMNRSLNGKLNEVSTEKAQLNKLDTANAKAVRPADVVSNGNIPTDELVQARKTELLRGRNEFYDKSNDPNINYSKAREKAKRDRWTDENAADTLDETAINHMSVEERETFNDNLTKEKEVLSRKENNIFQELNQNMTKYQLLQSFANQTSSGVIKAAEIDYQTDAGKAQAQASISQTNMQMAQQAVNDTIKNKDALASEAIQSLQMLNALAQCSRPV